MCELTVLDEHGDTTVTWDPANKTEVQVAKDKFDQLVLRKGYAAYELAKPASNADAHGVAIREFNPQAEHIFLTPRLVGG